MVELCGSERSTSWDAASSRSSPATFLVATSRPRPVAATGKTVGSTTNALRSARTACSSRCSAPASAATTVNARTWSPTPSARLRAAAGWASEIATSTGTRKRTSTRSSRRTNAPRDEPRTARRGSSNSERSTTAERDSITSSTRGTILRPMPLRSAGVTSTNARPPAVRRAVGPASGSATGTPNASSDAVEAMTRNALSPIGVTGRARPWARLMQNRTRSPSPAGGGSGCSVVIGRACVSHSVPASSNAHSMSCGDR